MATIGDQLIAPESGYQRYDDSNSKILYNGSNWTRADNISDNGGSHIATTNLGDVITFNFYSTKLRIISPINSGWSDNTQITIDGIIYNFSQYSSTLIFKTLVFEKLDLEEGIHTVEIKNITSGKYIGLDAIDIDENGYLLHPILLNQVTSTAEAQVGDCIPIRYTVSSSGQVGYLSEVGTCTANEIPVTGTATPDGLAYLVMVGYDYLGRKMFIPDRNLQTNISWDTLNNTGLVTGNNNLIIEKEHTPTMSSDNTPTPYITSASGVYDNDKAYKALYHFTGYNGDSRPWWNNGENGSIPCSWQIDLGEDNLQCINQIRLNAILITGTNYSIKKFNLYGSLDNSTWIKLLEVMNYPNSSVTQIYNFINNEKYRYYKIDNIESYHINANNVGIQNLRLFEVNKNSYVRLLTGGISSTDTENEWNQIIVNSDLNGTITAGDDNIWHWSRIYSWTSTTNISGATYRMIRGNTLVSNSSSLVTSSTASFRPVILVESDESNKFLIKQGNDYYSLKSEFYINNQLAPITLANGESPNDDDFKNNGFDIINDLVKVITTDSIIEIESNAETLEEGNLFRFDIPVKFRSINSIE